MTDTTRSWLDEWTWDAKLGYYVDGKGGMMGKKFYENRAREIRQICQATNELRDKLEMTLYGGDNMKVLICKDDPDAPTLCVAGTAEAAEAAKYDGFLLKEEFGGHSYEPNGTSDCAFGCECWAGDTRSGGPDEIDPIGECPENPINKEG